MTDRKKPTSAEEITRLLEELYVRVTTREKVAHYRQVRRTSERTVAVLDFREHTTNAPGLLTQLGVAHPRDTTVPVTVHRWIRDDCTCRPDQCEHGHRGNRPACDCRAEVCPHGRWVIDRVEQRTIEGVVTSGAALPGGSPGWDDDGAAAPLVGGSSDPGEPIGDAWHTAAQINDDLTDLERELHDQGHQGSLTDIALADENTGRRIAARLHSLVTRARIAADYDAPIVPLRDVYCPECGGQLRVRKDASSAVWCAGHRDPDGRRIGNRYLEGPALDDKPWPIPVCDATWPRGAWVALLEELDNQEAS